MILGIDPGISGGIALIARTGSLAWAEAMPVLRSAVPLIDAQTLSEWLRRESGVDVFAYVERAQSFPGQGIASAFNYGAHFGSILTALGDLGIGVELVSPAVWKKAAGLSKDKREAVAKVRQFYPRFPLKASQDGIAEAILIARHGLALQAGGG